VIYNIIYIKHTNIENVTLIYINPLILRKNKETKRDNLIRLGNNANIVINGDVTKCDIYSLLEI
jgi:hypothetical protein